MRAEELLSATFSCLCHREPVLSCLLCPAQRQGFYPQQLLLVPPAAPCIPLSRAPPPAEPSPPSGPQPVGWEPRAQPKGDRNRSPGGVASEGVPAGDIAPKAVAGLYQQHLRLEGRGTCWSVWVRGTERCTAAPGLGCSMAHTELFPFHFCRWKL